MKIFSPPGTWEIGTRLRKKSRLTLLHHQSPSLLLSTSPLEGLTSPSQDNSGSDIARLQ